MQQNGAAEHLGLGEEMGWGRAWYPAWHMRFLAKDWSTASTWVAADGGCVASSGGSAEEEEAATQAMFPVELEARALFEALSGAVILMDRDCRILASTPAARRVLARGTVVRASGHRPHLRLIDPFTEQRLRIAIERLYTAKRKAAVELIAMGQSPTQLVGLSLVAATRAVIVVHFEEADSERLPRADLLREQFGLTAAEARVSRMLAEGRRLREIAETLRVSVHTVRLHCKHVLTKTGSTNQAGLVRLMLTAGSLQMRR